jgi:hypothetical protein
LYLLSMKSQSQMHPKPRTLQFLFLFFAKMSLGSQKTPPP